MSGWQRQTKHFGHERGSKYACLIFNNRGMGKSDKPVFRYSTSEMAKDVVELVDQIGWTARRDLHVVGISMGGMIAQEFVAQPHSLVSCSKGADHSLGLSCPRKARFPKLDGHWAQTRKHYSKQYTSIRV